MKKYLAILSAAVLGFSGAFAAMPASFAVYAEELPTSGEMGADCTWSYDEATRTMTVSGTGAIRDVGSQESPNWCTCDYETLIIEEGITAIGSYAFDWLNGGGELKKVSLPKTLRRIGDYAFDQCRSLTAVTIPSGVESIEQFAFGRCTALETVTLEEGVKVIGESAFKDCSALRAVSFPESLLRLDSSAFYGCDQLTEISFPENEVQFGSEVFGETQWLADERAKSPLVIINHTLLDGTACTDTAVTIPDGVQRICGSAFSGCEQLAEITFPESVTAIGGFAFSGTAWLSQQMAEEPFVIVNGILLKVGTASGEISIPEGVTEIADWAFAGNETVTSVSMHSGVSAISVRAFSGCSAMTDIQLSDNIETIPLSAFTACSALKSIKLPANLVTVDSYAFQSCSALEEITLPDSVATIGNYVFLWCESLRSVTIGENATYIGSLILAEGVDNLETLTVRSMNAEFANNWFTRGTVIRGYDGSTAEAYAEKYGYTFESLGEAPQGETPQPTLRGDVDGSGLVDVSDAVLLARYLVEDSTAEITDQGLANADADSSGKVDPEDVIRIVKMIAKLE